jgi:hypothetical protein
MEIEDLYRHFFLRRKRRESQGRREEEKEMDWISSINLGFHQ